MAGARRGGGARAWRPRRALGGGADEQPGRCTVTPMTTETVPAPPPPHYGGSDRVSRTLNRLWYGSPVWVAPAAMLACMGSALAYTELAHPTQAGAGDAPSCLLKYTTGFICPGCGGTRAAWYLMHGDLPAAARHHALFVFAVPFLLYMYVAWAGRRVFGWKLPQLTLGPKVLGVFLAVWGVWSVLRNLPWAPFTWFYV
ncbi:DUF2752 domain-containing protein [Actinoplanes sp. NPDC049265]|uniref:DUF2752 domain-containing protein n=1 Tax=Actinoplanes sp. NPDC049265 TaxID=3363902 RepID=UPI0037223C1C